MHSSFSLITRSVVHSAAPPTGRMPELHLNMPLGLHEGSHHPIGAKQPVGAGLRQKGWDNSLVGPLLWAYAVSVLAIQGEVSASVLQTGREGREGQGLRVVCGGKGEISGQLDN